MIRQAALYLVSADDVRTARLRVAGRPVAYGVVAAAVRAGIQRVAVPVALRSPELEAALRASPRAGAAVAWLDDAAALVEGPTLLLPAAALAPAAALTALAAAAAPALLARSLGADAPMIAADAALLLRLRPSLLAGAPLGEALDRACKAGEVATLTTGHWCVRVADAAGTAEAEHQVYGELGSAIDTRLDTAVHRRLSRRVSRAAVATGVTPNAITVASGVVGMASVASFARGDAAAVVAGFLLYVVAVVLDHADGEVARLTLRASALGEWLDLLVDTLVHGTMLLALGVATARVTGDGLAVGVVGAVAVVVSGLLAKLWTPAPGDGVLDRLSSRDGFYGMLLAFVVVRLVAPAHLPALLLCIAVGAHAYWMARVALRLSRKTRRNPK